MGAGEEGLGSGPGKSSDRGQKTPSKTLSASNKNPITQSALLLVLLWFRWICKELVPVGEPPYSQSYIYAMYFTCILSINSHNTLQLALLIGLILQMSKLRLKELRSCA